MAGRALFPRPMGLKIRVIREEEGSVADVKLFVCCHQPKAVPDHPLLVPVQVGAALAEERFPGFFQDDTGENISEKNRSYCELTAQYWAWKNLDADYYGFFHYRRYLYPDAAEKRLYLVEREPTGALLEKLGYGGFEELIRQYDLLLPKAENMYLSVREHYARFHHQKDLELMERIVLENHPEMAEALERYLSGTVFYFGNIFIMRRERFRHFCGWLFPLLEEFDRRADVSGYDPGERRVDGYLAERLLGVYLTFWRDKLKLLELPRVQFYANREFVRRRILNGLLPPGSKRRSVVKRGKEAVKKALGI